MKVVGYCLFYIATRWGLDPNVIYTITFNYRSYHLNLN